MAINISNIAPLVLENPDQYRDNLLQYSKPEAVSILEASIGKRCGNSICLTSIQVQKIVAVAVIAISLAAAVGVFVHPFPDALRIVTLAGSIGGVIVSAYCLRNLCKKIDLGRSLEREQWVNYIMKRNPPPPLETIYDRLFQGPDPSKTALVAYKLLGSSSSEQYGRASTILVQYQRLNLLFDECVKQVPKNNGREHTIEQLRISYDAAYNELQTLFYANLREPTQPVTSQQST